MNNDFDKMYYDSKKELKIFGIKVAEWTDKTTRYDGKGPLITESTPNKDYFEQEFRKDNKKNEF